MTWTKITPPCGQRNDGLTVRITKAGYNQPTLVIRMARSLAATAGIPPNQTSRVDVLLGSGADAGCMMITVVEKGAYSCHPQGKNAALKVALQRPMGFPDDCDTTNVETAVFDGGLTFALPWYTRAADRAIGNHLTDVPGDPLSPEELKELDHALERMPPTLDAVEEAARPVAPKTSGPPWDGSVSIKEALARELGETPPAVFHVEQQTKGKPHNGATKTHIYHDSFEDKPRLEFTHNGKTCVLNHRQHTLVMKLYPSMGKGFIGDAVLMKAIDTKELHIMQVVMSKANRAVEPLGLRIERQPKIGYFMVETTSSAT